ncbi:MAG: TraR/DksA C4-type zinc finger protein [Vicingaceae bacterium]
MTKEEKEELKVKIEVEAKKLKAQIAALKEEIKPIAPENAIGRLSRMDAINNRSVNEAALRKAEIRLNALEEAKANINHANFGVCANCGADIPMGRLLLRPQSRSCVSCAH